MVSFIVVTTLLLTFGLHRC